MSTTELREKLIGKIQLTNDESILEEVYRVLELETTLSETYLLSPLEKKEIELGRKDIREGRILTNEEVNKEMDEWLNK
jgi:predicted transcriptional regulator